MNPNTPRNLNPMQMFELLARQHRPTHAFASSGSDFAAWKTQTAPLVLATLGQFPPRVEPNPQFIARWEHDGLSKEKWLIDVGPHISASFQINYPPAWNGQSCPAILCWHGHGEFGKDAVMGDDSSPQRAQDIKQHNYNYGHQMAQHGFVTFAIDWIGMGERNPSRKPNHRQNEAGIDWCDRFYLHATMLGMTSLSINITHGIAATDFACSLPGVDPARLGVMGLSGGGTMTLWSALCDSRFRAAEIICYCDLWEAFGFRDNNYCGMQVAPGLFSLVDLPDLQGLLAPLPLLVDIGAHDECFTLETTTRAWAQLKTIYDAAGAGAQLELDLFAGGHGWGGRKSRAFFERYLG